MFDRKSLLEKLGKEEAITARTISTTSQKLKSKSPPLIKKEKQLETHKDQSAEHHHHHRAHHKYSDSWIRLAFCVGGIYFFFLTWGVLQERISTIAYQQANGQLVKFSSFTLLNSLQSFTASIIAFLFIKFLQKREGHLKEILSNPTLLFELGRVALSGCMASPFGYAALKHLSYPTMVLGKSCKLVPVMLMNILVGGKRFSLSKYVTVVLITLGVCSFMLLEDGPSAGSKAKTTSWYGLLLLLVNLTLDGATNSWQDKLFVKWHISSQQLMLFMNAFSCLFLVTQLIITEPFNNQLSTGINFLVQNPKALRDILAFCLAGSLGQVFIFLTIEWFGSLTLVTVTVTRKLMTILLSLLWFDHRMNYYQWFSVALVFLALSLESFNKRIK
jgi:solute carrier family 35 (UDP-galactose transporter), member B1